MSGQDPTNRHGFDALYGLELTECSEEVARGRVEVRDQLRAAGGLVHGGVYAAIAETLASMGTAQGVLDRGGVPLGMSNNTSFLRPVSEGTIYGEATAVHRGRISWVWDVEMRDDQGRLCAVSRVTIAIKDKAPQ